VAVAVPYLIIVVAMGYTRQAVAIGIILAGLSITDRKSLGRFAIYIVFAAAFHKSAVIVLPLVALAARRQRIVTVGILVATAALLYFVFVRANIDLMMTNYVDAGYESQGAVIRVAMNLPPALLFLAAQHRFNLPEQQRLLWRNFAIAALVAAFLLLLTDATAAVDRLALYLIPMQMLVLSRLPEALAGRRAGNGEVVFAVIAYSAAIQFVWLNFAYHAEFWLPYQIYPLVN
jgi:hypothetical protein